MYKLTFDFIIKYGLTIIWLSKFVYKFFKGYTGTVPMALYDVLKEQVTVLADEYKLIIADKKVTMDELWKLFQLASVALVKMAEQVGGTGPEKKAAVMAALDKFYDDVIAPMDIQYVPNMVEPYVDGLLKKIALQMASGGIDALVAFMNDNGLFTKS